MKKNIFIAGHNGMVGSAISRLLESKNNSLIFKNRSELDLTNQRDVNTFFQNNSVDEVYLVAAMVGGIYANNTYPAEFIYNNLMIESNIIHESYKAGVKKLLFLGSSCIYPKESLQPINESSLLTGLLEPTNEPYAIAKIAGIKLCESYNRQYQTDYRCIMSTNIYGPGDNYHSDNSHVVPGLIRKFYEAKLNNLPTVKLWGTGKPSREFIFVQDLAEACIFVMEYEYEKYNSYIDKMNSHINVGTGEDIQISELAALISKVIGFKGMIEFDSSMPDGTMKKLLNVELIKKMGWQAKTKLDDGLKITYNKYIEEIV